MIYLPHLRRLGLEELTSDHFNSLVELDAQEQPHTSRADIAVFFGLPVLAGALAFWPAELQLRAVASLLNGVAILTALLFGVLVHVLSLGLRLADDQRFRASSRVAILTDELRANVSWACAVGVLLTTILAVTGAFAPDPVKGGLPRWLTSLILALFAHLMLTLLMILKRVRSTYKLLAL